MTILCLRNISDCQCWKQ